MKLDLWNLIIVLRTEIGTLLERTLSATSTSFVKDTGVSPLIDEESLGRLRNELVNKLAVLKDNLSRELTENEVYLVMFPLTLLCDEMVMSSLPKEQQTLWFLLQSELFQINYGGDVFYDFVDERLAKPDTPNLVFEVLYYCLSAGFVGKFGVDRAKVQRYKGLLSERIPGAISRARRKRRREAPELAASDTAHPVQTKPAEPIQRGRRAPFWYYAATLGVFLIFVSGMLLFSNL